MIFTIYSKNNCPYCEKIKTVMSAYDFKHVVYTLDEDFTRQQFIEEHGVGSTFPQVIMQDVNLESVKLGGCVDTVKYLKENKLI
jgi:glutaredoxin